MRCDYCRDTGCSYCSPKKAGVVAVPTDTKVIEGDIVVTINGGLDVYDIEYIRLIEKNIDTALAPLGFARYTTHKRGDFVKLSYRRFGVTL